MYGDAVKTMKEWIKRGVKAQMCVTSPPYFGLRNYGIEGQLGLEATPKEYVRNMVKVFRCVRDILADDGVLWLNIGDSYAGGGGGNYNKNEFQPALGHQVSNIRNKKAWLEQARLKPKDLIGIPWMLAFALREDGWFLRQDIVWDKPNCQPESVKDRCTRSHEYVFLLSKQANYFYDYEAIKEPAVQAAISGQERRNKRSVWSVASRAYTGAHFATFPPELIRPCVLAGSRAGDIVLDPFMGSGTTAAVATELCRRYLGCELNPEYAPLQKQRLAEVNPQNHLWA